MYDFQKIESQWQRFWSKNSIYKTPTNPRKKYYILEMYPYPSGDLHIGHFRNYVLGDTIARFKLMQGYDVLHPFGWDSFGLPAEESAIKKGINPKSWTLDNIDTSRETLKLMGISYDWDREIITSEPDYYKWTQWLFIKLFERKLAYRKKAYVNWCPGCHTTLANEQVKNEECWRCGTPVVKKEFTQWFFKITAYAERLLADLDNLSEWPEQVKNLQRNWIGKSVGLELDFQYNGKQISVFTTRPDTIYGVTFLAISPEVMTSPVDELVEEMGEKNIKIKSYIENSLKQPEIERIKTKNGIFTGEYAIHPLSKDRVPIWIADYVLPSYGTGVIMGVPAHDERDFEFAKSHKIPIQMVIQPATEKGREEKLPMQEAYTGQGTMINSGSFSGLSSDDGIIEIEKYVKEKGLGRKKVNYRLRDWLVSRQRYWGAPIPIIHCRRCGEVPVPIDELPVHLPEKIDFTPKGKSPLASAIDFVNTHCPRCGGDAQRDTDTMDTFVDSSWYWLRYLDPKNDTEPFSQESAHQWVPIDEYIGGIEHATGHLIYFRFIAKFLYDEGLISQNEPCIRLSTHGMIMDKNGQVMSKSKGNAVPVGPFVREWGADTGRVTILFIGPPERDSIWSLEGITGVSRFLSRVYNLVERSSPLESKKHALSGAEGRSSPLELKVKGKKLKTRNEQTPLYRSLNRTIKKVTQDIENYSHNTAIAALMTFVNELYQAQDDQWFGYGLEVLVQLIAPFAPHLAEELWIEKLGNSKSVFKSKWPQWEEIEEETVTIVVEVNGKVRAKVQMPKDTSEDSVKSFALQIPKVANRIEAIKKVIFVPNKLINFVVC